MIGALAVNSAHKNADFTVEIGEQGGFKMLMMLILKPNYDYITITLPTCGGQGRSQCSNAACRWCYVGLENIFEGSNHCDDCWPSWRHP